MTFYISPVDIPYQGPGHLGRRYSNKQQNKPESGNEAA